MVDKLAIFKEETAWKWLEMIEHKYFRTIQNISKIDAIDGFLETLTSFYRSIEDWSQTDHKVLF